MNKRVAGSLKLQLFCSVLISLLVGVAVFGLTFLLGHTLLDHTVYALSFAETMADQQFSRLQEYVEEEAVSLDNLQRLNAWCSRGEKVYLAVYEEDSLVYESHISDKQKLKLLARKFNPDLEDPENEYCLVLHGGTEVRAFLYYYAGDAYSFGMTVLSGLTAFVFFSLCFVFLINRKVSYITLLKQELDILSGGQLEYPVTISGHDELGDLASGIDQMRRSIIKHQEMENQMRSANSELITAMSHDLRTPLTSLLAYLEIIERRKYASDEQMHSLIRKSVVQTLRIKSMADKLFEYFLAYATEWESAAMETVDADPLFEQILGDYAYSLESSGLQVENLFTPTCAKISINMELLQRALDNLYSNLLKYADPRQSIRIGCHREDRHILISISNGIRPHQEKNDSTGIGLITCRRIIEYHRGQFASSEAGGVFQISIRLPLQE